MPGDNDQDDLVQPSYVPDPFRQPKPETPQVLSIRPGSKLAVLGVFVEILRRRFAPPNVDADFPWPWNKTPASSMIEIESAFNEDKPTKNKRPAIYVDVDEQVNSRTVLGDMAGKDLRQGRVGFWHLRTIPILIECVASKKAESAIIADLADVFLMASNRLIQAKFGFHDMTPTTVGRTQPNPRDKNEYITPVTFTVQSVLRYTNAPTAPLLEDVALAIEGSTADSATAFFEAVALSRASK